MKVINFPQRSPQWHRWRAEGIGASEASVILCLSAYKTVWRLWAEKTGRAKEEDISRNPHVIRGIKNEDIARQCAEHEYDLVNKDRARQCAEHEFNGELLLPVCAESDKYPFIHASLDGIDSSGIPTELKCPCESQWADIIANEENSEGYKTYYPQVQQQILVTEAPYAWMLFYSPENNGDYRIFKVLRDDDLIKQIIDKAIEFWTHVEKDAPPDLDTKRDLFIPDDENDVNEWIENARNYRLMDQQIKELKEKLSTLEQRKSINLESMKTCMGDFLKADFAGVNITRFKRTGTIDYKKYLAENYPDFDADKLELYRRSGSAQTRVTVTNVAMPKNITDISVKNRVANVEEGKIKAMFF